MAQRLGAAGCLQPPLQVPQAPSVQPLVAVGMRAQLSHLWSRDLQAWDGPRQRKRSGYPAQGAAQAPERSDGFLPSFLGPDGPVKTDHLVTSMGQVTQRVVCILRKNDLGREDTGSNSAMGQAPHHGLEWGRQVPGDAPLSRSPQMPRSIQAAPTHHGHQGQCLLLQLALDSLGDVSDVRQGKVLKLLRAQVPRMGLKQLERLPGTWDCESRTSVPPPPPLRSWTLSALCPQSLPSCVSLSPCPRTHLRSSSHLPHQVVSDDIGQQPQQSVACLGVTVEPALSLGHCSGATTFNHVGHERPL